MATVASAGQGRARIAITLATLSATAFLTAQGSTQLIASAALDVPLEVPPLPPATASAAHHTRDGHPLLSHQIFDSALGAMDWDLPVVEGPGGCESDADCAPGQTCTDGACTGGEEAPPTTTWSPGDPQPPPCDGSIRLVGSYVRHATPDQSFAAIIGASGSSLLYRTGMVIDDRVVIAVQPNFVVLRPPTAVLCSIGLFGDAPAVATARTAPPPVVAPPPDSAGDPALGITGQEMEQNIQQISETSFSINRTLVDRLLANQAALMSAARVIPHEEDGHVVGVKIYGIRRSSLLGHLGIQNGDMLRTLNGFDLTDPTAVLDAYSRLRTADSLSISMVRRGQPVTVDYSIH